MALGMGHCIGSYSACAELQILELSQSPESQLAEARLLKAVRRAVDQNSLSFGHH